MPAMRKYTFASCANGSLYTVRRLFMSRRPRRTCSETELTFNESTSLVAALLSVLGMMCAGGSSSRGAWIGWTIAFSETHIFDSDSIRSFSATV
jgi:hypothetical protein